MEKFGERVRELRKERGLTVHEMAKRLGISRNTLTTWELGEKEPHTLEIVRNIERNGKDIASTVNKFACRGKRNTNRK